MVGILIVFTFVLITLCVILMDIYYPGNLYLSTTLKSLSAGIIATNFVIIFYLWYRWNYSNIINDKRLVKILSESMTLSIKNMTDETLDMGERSSDIVGSVTDNVKVLLDSLSAFFGRRKN